MKSYLRFTLIFLFTLGIFLLQTPSAFAGYQHNIRGEALTIGGAYEGNEYSLEFDGSSNYMEANDEYKNMDELTVSFWYWNSGNISSYRNFILGNSHLHAIGNPGFRFIQGYDNPNRIQWRIEDNNGNWVALLSSNDLPLEEWVLVTGKLSFSDNSVNLYINNQGVGSSTAGGDKISGSGTNFRIGKNTHGENIPNNSLIYDVRIYNRALSAEEIDRLYRGVEVSDTGLVGHWKLDEGSGTTASDSSGNNNHGTLVNSPTWSSDVPEIRDRFVYFNCLDEPRGSFPYTFPFPLGGDPCEINHTGLTGDVNNYGVNLDYNDYTLSGYALHDEFGLISFRNGIPFGETYDFVNNCSETTSDNCNSTNNCSACYDGAYDYEQDQSRSQRVYGWAYVVESDDWIKLDSDEVDSVDGFKILDISSSDPGDFEGYFYNQDWGMVDLNCERPTYDCSTDYKVHIGKVELAEMSAPYWGESKACSTTAKGAVLRWKVHGGQFNRYDIRINDTNDFNTADEFSLAEGNVGYNSFQSTVGEYGFDYELDWNTSYTWWLRLHDDHVYSTSTDWIQFDHSGNSDVHGVLTDNEDENTTNSFAPDKTFTTYKHEWPRPYFTWEGHPDPNFLAGAANRFEVTEDTYYHTGTNPEDKVSFGDSGFEENFSWWGEIDGQKRDKITIVNAIDFPEAKDPIFRLDATSIEGLEHNESIGEWLDQSDGNFHVEQNNDNNKPKYHINALDGRPAVSFDGSSFMENNIIEVTQPFTIFAVTKSDANLSDAYVLDSIVEEGVALGYSAADEWLMWAGAFLTSGSTNDNLTLWRAYYNDASSTLNIKQEGEPSFEPITEGQSEFINNKDGIVIGASYNNNKHWEGYIAEIIIYQESLNNSEIADIEEYLINKWGIEEDEEATAPQVDVYFESIDDDQKVWLSLTDPTGYTCSTTTPDLNVDFELPLWREIRARENQ